LITRTRVKIKKRRDHVPWRISYYQMCR